MDARSPRGTAVLAVAAAILMATPVAATDTGADQSAGPTEVVAPMLDGTWKQLADPPFGSNFGAGAWTGAEVLVVDVPTGRAAAYDIGSDAWTVLSDGPEGVRPEGLGSNSPTVWTGRELLLFDNTYFDDGQGSDRAYAFDPTTSTWRDLAPMPFVPNFAVWADGQAVIADPQRHVAAYDPELDVWPSFPERAVPRNSKGSSGAGRRSSRSPRRRIAASPRSRRSTSGPAPGARPSRAR